METSFNERRWISSIRETLNEETEEDYKVHVNIFSVPKTLMNSDPDSYTPQQVAIGPYHCLRAEVYDMERYKLAAAKRHQKEFQNQKLQDFVDQLINFEVKIRGSYHKSLNFNGDTLAWMMAVDASFLFEVLLVCAVKEAKVLTDDPSKLSHLIAIAGNKTAFQTVLRDIVMLENQIPLFVLRKLLEFQYLSLEAADNMLVPNLILLGKELSPFKLVSELPNVRLDECAHLLDFLYQFVVPKVEGWVCHEIIEVVEQGDQVKESDESSFAKPSHVGQCLREVWKILAKLEHGAVRRVKSIVFSKPVKVLTRLPSTVISKIPILNTLMQAIEHIFSSSHKEDKDGEDSSSKSKLQKAPLLQEISIPSVTSLFKVGVKFISTGKGIDSIAFDIRTATLSLPAISLDENSDVVLRNLVAYEVCSAPGPLVLARYTELMNGIIDTEEDAKFLREGGIIKNRLKSDKEVADLWNGMSKSIRLTKVPYLDKVIEDVNKYYNGKWKVKFGRFMKKYIFHSWRILTLLAAIMLLLLMCLQSFCQVYTCSRIFRIEGLERALIGE